MQPLWLATVQLALDAPPAAGFLADGLGRAVIMPRLHRRGKNGGTGHGAWAGSVARIVAVRAYVGQMNIG